MSNLIKFPFVDKDGCEHCLRIWNDKRTNKRYIEILYQYLENDKTWSGAWKFEASAGAIKTLLIDNTLLGEDVRKYFGRIIKNLIFL